MSAPHNTPVRTTCRTASEFKDDLTFAAAVLVEQEGELLKLKDRESLQKAFVLRECARRIMLYTARTKLEGM